MAGASLAMQFAKNVGNDQFTKALLHFDSGVVDYAAGASAAKTWTLNSATISASASKFGGASLSAAGSQWVEAADSADFTLGSSDFTIDTWFNVSGGAGLNRFLTGQISSAGTDSSSSFGLFVDASNHLSARLANGSTVTTVAGTTAITTTGWHHCAFVRTGNTLLLFLDGVQEGTAAFSVSVNDSANKLSIGRFGELSTQTFNGFVDEFRLSVGVARWTAAFTPPAVPYG